MVRLIFAPYRETVYYKHKFGHWQLASSDERNGAFQFTPSEMNHLLRKMIHGFESFESPQADDTCCSKWCKYESQTCNLNQDF